MLLVFILASMAPDGTVTVATAATIDYTIHFIHLLQLFFVYCVLTLVNWTRFQWLKLKAWHMGIDDYTDLEYIPTTMGSRALFINRKTKAIEKTGDLACFLTKYRVGSNPAAFYYIGPNHGALHNTVCAESAIESIRESAIAFSPFDEPQIVRAVLTLCDCNQNIDVTCIVQSLVGPWGYHSIAHIHDLTILEIVYWLYCDGVKAEKHKLCPNQLPVSKCLHAACVNFCKYRDAGFSKRLQVTFQCNDGSKRQKTVHYEQDHDTPDCKLVTSVEQLTM